MRLVLKLVLPGLSNAEAKSLVMMARPPSWHRVRGGGGEVDSSHSLSAHMGLVQSLLVNGPHPTWQGFTDKLTRLSSAKASHLFMASKVYVAMRFLRSMPPLSFPAPTTALISHFCPTVSHLKSLVDLAVFRLTVRANLLPVPPAPV
jgi:hypothetical protein